MHDHHGPVLRRVEIDAERIDPVWNPAASEFVAAANAVFQTIRSNCVPRLLP